MATAGQAKTRAGLKPGLFGTGACATVAVRVGVVVVAVRGAAAVVVGVVGVLADVAGGGGVAVLGVVDVVGVVGADGVVAAVVGVAVVLPGVLPVGGVVVPPPVVELSDVVGAACCAGGPSESGSSRGSSCDEARNSKVSRAIASAAMKRSGVPRAIKARLFREGVDSSAGGSGGAGAGTGAGMIRSAASGCGTA